MWKEYTHVSEEHTSTIYKVEDPLHEDEDKFSSEPSGSFLADHTASH